MGESDHFKAFLFVCFAFVNDILPWFGQLAVPGIFSLAFLAPKPMSDTKLVFSMSLVWIILSEPYMSIRYQSKCDGLACEKVDDMYQMRPLEWAQKAEQRWSLIWSICLYVYIIHWFIYVAALGLSCSMQDLWPSLWQVGCLAVSWELLVAACGNLFPD